jgi:toxin FitB
MSDPSAFRSGFLLDTNLLSETRRKRADVGVIDFLKSCDSTNLYISVLTIGELRKGIVQKQRVDPQTAAILAGWADGMESTFADRILPITIEITRLWGEWSGERPRAVIDTLLAATASIHHLTLVTRNAQDLKGIPVQFLNPWHE